MVTIRDVAAAAGVAPSTVSYALSGKKRLPPETVEKVRRSILELGYRPHATARALALGRTEVIGLLATVSPQQSETDAEVFMRFVRSAMFTARRRGYDVLVLGRGDDELFGEPMIDALVVMDVQMEDPRLPLIAAMGRPTVLLGHPTDALGLPSVDLDFAASGALAVQHLHKQGHRDVIVLAPPAPSGRQLSWVVRFERGLADAAEAHGMTHRTLTSGAGTGGTEFLDEIGGPGGASALIVLDLARIDELLAACAGRGMRVPQDLSIVALAPDEQMARAYPALTLLDLPGRDMIALAVETVLASADGLAVDAVQLLPPRLVERGSTGPARG